MVFCDCSAGPVFRDDYTAQDAGKALSLLTSLSRHCGVMGTYRQTPSHPRNRGLTEVMSPAEPRLLAQHRAAFASMLLLLQTTRCHHPASDRQVCVSVLIPQAPNRRSQPPLTASGLSLDGDATQLPSYCIPGSTISPWAARLSHCSIESPRNSPSPAHPASP